MAVLVGTLNGQPCRVNMSDGPFIIQVGKRVMRFEHDGYLGSPWVLDRDDDPLDDQPGERHPFWRAYGLWTEQGRQMDGDRCIYAEPEPTVVRKMGRHLVVISHGSSEYARTVQED